MSNPADPARPAAPAAQGAVADASEPYAWEGDDDHVIFWMLSLTPTQRVEAAQNFVQGVLMLRNGLRS